MSFEKRCVVRYSLRIQIEGKQSKYNNYRIGSFVESYKSIVMHNKLNFVSIKKKIDFLIWVGNTNQRETTEL